jgi:predicted alpha/beta hydrolase family esterase
MRHAILLLPGLNNSGAGHWQTLWEKLLPNARRVQQQDWDQPQREDWVAALDAEIEALDGTVTLVAHSLGCALTAWWAAEHRATAHAAKVTGALLVAPPDVERADFPVEQHGFAPMPRAALPFKSIVVASTDDPWCALSKARSWARDWGAEFHDIGALSHINASSDLGDWQQGRAWLAQLEKAA